MVINSVWLLGCHQEPIEMKPNPVTAVAIAALLTAGSMLAQPGLGIAAQVAEVASPFVLTNGYVFQPIETGITNSGRAVYSFSLTNSGQFAIQAITETPNPEVSSLFVNIDSEPEGPEMVWKIPAVSGLKTNLVTTGLGRPRYFNLGSGDHQIIIRGREPNVKLWSLNVIARPSPPITLRIVSNP
jgi:hypothetical protein